MVTHCCFNEWCSNLLLAYLLQCPPTLFKMLFFFYILLLLFWRKFCLRISFFSLISFLVVIRIYRSSHRSITICWVKVGRMNRRQIIMHNYPITASKLERGFLKLNQLQLIGTEITWVLFVLYPVNVRVHILPLSCSYLIPTVLKK